jgi:hypothetical protein
MTQSKHMGCALVMFLAALVKIFDPADFLVMQKLALTCMVSVYWPLLEVRDWSMVRHSPYLSLPTCFTDAGNSEYGH